MCAAAAVGVDDDFAPGESGVAVGAADEESAGGVDVEHDVVVPPLFVGREDHGLDDLFDDLVLGLAGELALLVEDGLVVLGGDDDGVDADGALVFVGDGDL